MKNVLTKTTGGLALMLGLHTGCGAAPKSVAPIDSPLPPGPSPEQPANDATQVTDSIQQSLARLDKLEIFQTDSLVSKLPAEAFSCYGSPCPGGKWEKPFLEERARQAPRLARLADIAEVVSRDTSLTPRDPNEAASALAALNALEVVHVEFLVEAQPKNNPECYGLPCTADKADADRATGLHVAQALAIADVAKRTGL